MIGIPELLIAVIILLTIAVPIGLLAFIAYRLVKKPPSQTPCR